GCRPTCCRRSATTSAPTPTSAWTGRAASSSTPTGRAAAAPRPRRPTTSDPQTATPEADDDPERAGEPGARRGAAAEGGAGPFPADLPAAVRPLRRIRVAEKTDRRGLSPGPPGGRADHGGGRPGPRGRAGAVLVGGEAGPAAVAG